MKEVLKETVRYLHSKGWAPATSSNYSFRNPNAPESIWISKSGIDKRLMNPEHLVAIDRQGTPLTEVNVRTSAETGLHLMIYERFPETQCILHTHSVANTVAGIKYPRGITFQGLEMQKAIQGQTTHETPLLLPVFPNSQDISTLADTIRKELPDQPESFGFLIAGHGLYAWGATIEQAARHIEAWEFLLETQLLLDTHGYPAHS